MRAPALFIVHCAPSLAVAGSPYAEALARYGARSRAPDAVIAISDRWRSRAPQATAARAPALDSDSGSTRPVLDPGSFHCAGWPQLAHRLAEKVGGTVDRERGLDQ